MSFGVPWLAALGVLLAAVPVLLHFVARRPPSRAPLPTARFLSPESRSRIQFTRRPTDPALMVLRALFVLCLFAALARPRWTPPRSGTADLVLVDASADRVAVRAALAPFTDAHVLAFDSATHVYDADAPVTDVAPDYAAAFRAVPEALARLGADSARVWLVTSPRWAGWSPGTAAARALWPGDVGLIAVPHVPLPTHSARVPPDSVVVMTNDTADAVARALRALGLPVRVDPAAVSADVLFTMNAGAIVVTLDTAVDTASASRLVVAGDVTLAARGSVVLPPTGARVQAAWDDGRPAAFARFDDGGCTVVSGIDLRFPAIRASPRFPTLLARLAAGCSPSPDPLADTPLDAGALALLGGTAPPAATAIPAAGRPIGRLLLILAFLFAALETLLVLRGRGTSSASAGTSAP